MEIRGKGDIYTICPKIEILVSKHSPNSSFPSSIVMMSAQYVIKYCNLAFHSQWFIYIY